MTELDSKRIHEALEIRGQMVQALVNEKNDNFRRTDALEAGVRIQTREIEGYIQDVDVPERPEIYYR
jgi:hypothetical protein